MRPYDHGGDVYSHPVELDFSSNINPMGMPDAALAALCACPSDFEAYPDPRCLRLTSAVAQAEGVPESWVLCTAGASDAFLRVCLALRPRTALVVSPSFSGYGHSLRQADAEIRTHDLRECEGFALTDRVLADLTPDVDLAFFCTPNNPTGCTVEAGLLERIVARAAAQDTVVVVDECFLDFADQPSAVRLCAAYPQLIVVKAFTKSYAMAGLRVGWCVCSDEALLDRVYGCGAEWAVSSPAQAAALAALSEAGYLERTRAYVAAERAYLASGLAESGLRVVPSEANYLLFQVPVAFDLKAALLERGILIRSFVHCRNLGPTWFRVAVRTHRENVRLLHEIQEVSCAWQRP
ncbi:pyridoxal phosphate-dependent aminotransferase [Slackia heliotrinireducens]|uniref:pyridoxal phosphate-dependent aminotransferase n=1 Tax=Slackia heliotrinireducens TaxID=84110 RepID=UPI003314E18D